VDWIAILRTAVEARGGLITRQQLLSVVPKRVLDRHVNRSLVRVLPHVYRWRDSRLDDHMLLRAALLHAGPSAALSHTTALAVLGLRKVEMPLHLTVDQTARRAGARDIVVHRRIGFEPSAPQCVIRHGLLITSPPRSLVDSWPLLPRDERRPFVIEAVRKGITTAELLAESLMERPNIAGHRTLAQAIDLIADGCQSELEVLGVLNVFRHPSLPRGIGQYRIEVGGVAYHPDRAWPEAKLAVELDGARHHTSPEDRRRDLARDAALAAAGWVVLRFTYADVQKNPELVRARVLAVYRTRMAQLAAS
jgi:hypothetical protein